MKRFLVVGLLAVLTPVVAPAAPAHAAVQSWAHVWDVDQTSSTSGSSSFTFPHKANCPDSFHVSVAWVKWRYKSPEGATVRLTRLTLRLKPNHKMRVTIDGLNRWFAADEYTTRRYDIDTSKNVPLLAWDGGDAVGVHLGLESAGTSTYYAPGNHKVAGACKQPTHLAGLKRHF